MTLMTCLSTQKNFFWRTQTGASLDWPDAERRDSSTCLPPPPSLPLHGRASPQGGGHKLLLPTEQHTPGLDAAILSSMLRPGPFEGDAVEAQRVLVSQGLIDESYTPQAVLNRFRQLLAMSS